MNAQTGRECAASGHGMLRKKEWEASRTYKSEERRGGAQGEGFGCRSRTRARKRRVPSIFGWGDVRLSQLPLRQSPLQMSRLGIAVAIVVLCTTLSVQGA